MKISPLRARVIELRKLGRTRSEIEIALGITIPKATFAYWTRNLTLGVNATRRLEQHRYRQLTKARAKSQAYYRAKAARNQEQARLRNAHLQYTLESQAGAKLALAMLYLAEGTKSRGRAALTFGNADPATVRLFLRLLRCSYVVDETRFRCTVQCRADQSIEGLESFWSHETHIPREQFYAARIDPRTRNQVSRNPKYCGVCRIDYFSSELFTDLMETIKLLLDTGR